MSDTQIRMAERAYWIRTGVGDRTTLASYGTVFAKGGKETRHTACMYRSER